MFDFIARFGKIKNENRSITLKADCECKRSKRKREQSMNAIKKNLATLVHISSVVGQCSLYFFLLHHFKFSKRDPPDNLIQFDHFP